MTLIRLKLLFCLRCPSKFWLYDCMKQKILIRTSLLLKFTLHTPCIGALLCVSRPFGSLYNRVMCHVLGPLLLWIDFWMLLHLIIKVIINNQETCGAVWVYTPKKGLVASV